MAASETIFSISGIQINSDQLLKEIVSYVFRDSIKQNLDNITSQLPPYGNIRYLVRSAIDDIVKNSPKSSKLGRLGPDHVNFDKTKVIGSFIFNQPLGLCSQNNFSTIKADTCIYTGKWQYEVMLMSGGLMQIGWATQDCKFSEEYGVGDTDNSFAYDGNRRHIWNKSGYKYGELWQCGDIITCCIDLDNCEVSFFRNGHALGIAFKNIQVGPGIAYFPAMSLSLNENFTVNFGSTNLKYPQPDYSTLEVNNHTQLLCAQKCFSWIKEIINLTIHWETICTNPQFDLRAEVLLLITSEHVCSHLGPLLGITYIIEECLIPIIEKTSGLSNAMKSNQILPITKINLDKTHLLFKYLIASLEEHELKKCIESLLVLLVAEHKQTSSSLDFTEQRHSLTLLYILLSYKPLRKFCLNNVLFDNKFRFFSFMNIKMIDEESLKEIVPEIYYENQDKSFSSGNEEAYLQSIKRIKIHVDVLESLQMSILELLMDVTDDQNFKNTSRNIFLSKLEAFLRESMRNRQNAAVLHLFPCLFHRLMSLFNKLGCAEYARGMPIHVFLDDSMNFFDLQRLGGLESHMKKTLKKEISAALDSKNASINRSEEKDVEMSDASVQNDILGMQWEPSVSTNTGTKMTNDENLLRTSLYRLLNNIILVYHQGVHPNLAKNCGQTDMMQLNISYLIDVRNKMKSATKRGLPDTTLNILLQSECVILEKLHAQCRVYAWTRAAVLSPECFKHFLQFAQTNLCILKNTSKEDGLFGFVPGFYVETLSELCLTFRKYFPSPNPNDTEFKQLLTSMGEFLALHFIDSRIIYAETKEALSLALCGFVAQKNTLERLENMPSESRHKMVCNLLQPCENRPWAQSNWILVRFWKGRGFAFRFNQNPHLSHKLGPKPVQTEKSAGFALNTEPHPSEEFQNIVMSVLSQYNETKTSFLNSLLDQLNWVFSELIAMLQEIHDASRKPERVFIDSQQLDKCATYFDLAVILLRVLEMIVSIASHHFLDFTQPNAELWLTRLCQLVCQILNRINNQTKFFNHVVDLEVPGLENIHHFPLITAIMGVLIALLDNTNVENTMNSIATNVLLKEASFEMSFLTSIINQDEIPNSDQQMNDSDDVNPTASSSGEISTRFTRKHKSNSKQFLLNDYPNEITDSELRRVSDLINHLHKESLNMSNNAGEDSVEDGSLCTICYAYSSNALFSPCGHSSCRTCITQYLMNRKECFFCKTKIKMVTEKETDVVIFKSTEDSTNAAQ